jgi:hypothetical protein
MHLHCDQLSKGSVLKLCVHRAMVLEGCLSYFDKLRPEDQPKRADDYSLSAVADLVLARDSSGHCKSDNTKGNTINNTTHGYYSLTDVLGSHFRAHDAFSIKYPDN